MQTHADTSVSSLFRVEKAMEKCDLGRESLLRVDGGLCVATWDQSSFDLKFLRHVRREDFYFASAGRRPEFTDA